MKLLIALAFLIFSPVFVDACVCSRYGVPVCATYWESDAVFVGQVQSITKPGKTEGGEVPMATVHFKVNETFRGISTPTVDVKTLYGTSCDMEFVKGRRYLIYADREDSELLTGMCYGSTEAKDATEDLNYIRSVTRAEAKESIGGRTVYMIFTPVTDVRIEVKKGNQTFETKPDAQGYYSVGLDGPGTYQVRLSVPRSVMVAEGSASKVDTTDTLTTIDYEVLLQEGWCDYRQFDIFGVDLHATAEVSGKVLAASDGPVGRGIVSLVRASDPRDYRFKTIQTDGTFKFTLVPVGEYYLVLNPNNQAPGQDDAPHLRAYYPSGSEVTSAVKLVVAEGAILENLTLRVGPPLQARTVSGKAVWSNGKGVRDARISLYDKQRYVQIFNVSKDGEFSFEVYGDFDYEISAETWKAPFGKSPRIKLGPHSTNLKLVLKRK